MIKVNYYNNKDYALPLLGIDFFGIMPTDAQKKGHVLRMRQIQKKDPEFLTSWLFYFKIIIWRHELVLKVEYRKPFKKP